MTTTPGDDYETSELVSSRDGLAPEDDGTTPGPGPRGADLGETQDAEGAQAALVADDLARTPGPGPDGADLGEASEEIGKVRRAHVAKHAAGRTPGPGPE